MGGIVRKHTKLCNPELLWAGALHRSQQQLNCPLIWQMHAAIFSDLIFGAAMTSQGWLSGSPKYPE
jgi:hypothetical protein